MIHFFIKKQSYYPQENCTIRNKQEMTIFEEWLDANSLTHEPHQKEAVDWCLTREQALTNKGGIIADEMGLGKTIEILGTVYSNAVPNTLIVLPYSLILQWEKIIVKLMGIQPLIYHGSKRKNLTVEEIKLYPIVLTTYGLISKKRQVTESMTQPTTPLPLFAIQWDRVIYDEAHHLRNEKTAVHKGARNLHTAITWLMTGTPIQNGEKDLFNLYKLLGFKNIKENIEMLVREHMLRRTKEKAGIVLPPCNASIISVEWKYSKERLLSEHIHSRLKFSNLAALQEQKEAGVADASAADAEASEPKLLETAFPLPIVGEKSHLKLLCKAKKMCVLPKLMKKKYRLVIDGVLQQPRQQMVEMLKNASKIEHVVKTILERKDNGKPKLVFCYFHGEIDEIYRLLKIQGINVAKFDGRTGKKERLQLLQEPKAVLIGQIDATNEGLNLQAYKEIYMVSPHWNPAVEDQAIARCHRIGQTEPVAVFHFIMNGFPTEATAKVEDANTSAEEANVIDPKEPVLKALTLDQHICNVQDIKRKIVKKLLLF